MTNLIKRILSGIFLILLVLFVSYKGGLILLLATSIISILSALEFKNALSKLGFNYSVISQSIFGILLNIFTYYKKYDLIILLIAILFIVSFLSLSLGNRYNSKDVLGFIFAFLYCNYLFNFILLLENPYQIFIVFLCSWGTDTFAYVFGMLFGRRKLIEKLSPNKTVEGSIGGSILAVLLTIAYVKLIGVGHITQWGIIALVLSIFSQIGDLCASYIKRKSGLKDFGNIIIGHGGILDRFDSVLFVLPLAYMAINLIGV